MQYDLHTLANSITGQFRDLEQPQDAKIIAESMDYTLIKLDNVIFKIAKHEEAHQALLAERSSLLQFQGYLGGLQVPYPKYYFTSKSLPFGSIGYKELDGRTPKPSEIKDTQRHYKNKVASFLSQLHSKSEFVTTEKGFGIYPPPSFQLRHKFDRVDKYLQDNFDNKEYSIIKQFQDHIVEYYQSYIFEPNPIHGDCWYKNHLIEPSTGELVGIVDFSSFSLGDPIVDVVVQKYVSESFMHEVFQEYQRLQSNNVDIDIDHHAFVVLGLRELLFLEKGIRLGSLGENINRKIEDHIIDRIPDFL